MAGVNNGKADILYCAFKGMGDLLNAAPVIAQELDDGHTVKLLIFPGFSLENFVELLDFGLNRDNLELVFLPVSGRPREVVSFLAKLSKIRPELIWISPHVPVGGAWKIPMLLWVIKKIFWPNARMAGASSERAAFLFDEKIDVDRNLPIKDREYVAYSALGRRKIQPGRRDILFVDHIRRIREEPPRIDLLIHPGANAANRRWPWNHFGELVRQIPAHYRLAVLGLPDDIAKMRGVLPGDRDIQFLSGTLEFALRAISSSKVVLTMDSGTVHFADSLGVPAVALFGVVDPKIVIGRGGSVVPIYEPKFPCQPCGKASCSQSEVLCMNSIRPERVAEAVNALLSRELKNQLSNHGSVGSSNALNTIDACCPE
jgi:heptosyltransferase II